MEKYVKPVVMVNDDITEGIYMASGDEGEKGSAKCDSKYMKGTWQAPDYSNWPAGTTRSYRQQFGCLGCPAYTGTACGLLTHYQDSGEASSYEADNGNRMPSWERKGYKPDDPVTDWNM